MPQHFPADTVHACVPVAADLDAWFAALPFAAAMRRGDALTLNGVALALLGYAADAGTDTRGWLARLGVDTPDLLAHLHVCAPDPRASEPLEVAVRHADGSLRVLEALRIAFGDAEVWLAHDITRRRELLNRLETTSKALDGVGLIHCVLDRTGRIVDVNDFACRRLGYAREALVGRSARSIDVHLDDQREAIARELLAGGQVVQFESEYRTAAGEHFPVEVTLCSSRAADGTPIAMVLTRDIDDEKRHERQHFGALERDQRQARLLARLAMHPAMTGGELDRLCQDALSAAADALAVDGAGIWLLEDEDRRLTPLAIHPHGYSAQAIDAAALGEYLACLRAGEVIDAVDVASDKRTCALFTAGCSDTVALLDAPLMIAGRLVGVLCLEHKQDPRQWTAAEIGFARSLAHILAQGMLAQQRVRDVEALRASEERHARAQRAAGFGSWEYNLLTCELWWSEQMYRLFGVREGGFRPTREAFQSLVHPDDRASVLAAFNDAVTASGRFGVEYRVLPGDGSERVILDSGVVQRDSRGFAVKITGTALDVTERRRQEQRIHRLAFYDPLTGLPNRSLLTDRIDRCVIDARREHTSFALLFLDLDHFKKINDSLGHDQGDRLLRQVAERLRASLREQDTVARLGGDEFMVLLPQVPSSHAARTVAHTLLAELRRPFALGDGELEISVSIGVSCYPQDGTDAGLLVRNADTAMYAAKEAGRDGVQFFSMEMNAQARRRITLEAGLRRALERSEFELHVQPIWTVDDEELFGCEALLRWRHPQCGMMMPAEFLTVAEQSGLIVPIGEWVVNAACALQRQWCDRGLGVVPVSVNLSALQLRRGDIVAVVEQALSRSGIDPALLSLEITETVLMERVDAVLPMLGRLRRLGVRLAVDDFGTGYSSLSYLKRLPLDILKIDRSFIQTLGDGEAASEVIAAAVIRLARDLGLQVIAEGIETEAQLSFVRRERCHGFQGYLRSPPLAPAVFERLLASATHPMSAAG